jgi:hypothetical protein
MRLTVGPLPPAVYWRRRAAVAVALALVIVLLAMMSSGPDVTAPTTQPSFTGSPRIPDLSTSAAGSPGTQASGGIGASGGTGSSGTGAPAGSGSPSSGMGNGADNGGDGGGKGGLEVATVACADEEISLTAAVSPSPGIYGGTITLTLIMRNTADHACLRDVGSAEQELQIRQGDTVVWSSDHCDTPQASDVRAFGPNIESRFWRWWNTYRVAPDECDPPADAAPAEVGT